MKYVVIVDRSEPPGSLNGVQVFGPYTALTADSIMGEINGEAMAGEISLNWIAVAPINEGTFHMNVLTSLIKKTGE